MLPVQSPLAKIFSFAPDPNQLYIPRHPVPTEGRWPSSRTLGRDAVDAGGAKDEGADLRTAKSCGPDASTPASSQRKPFPLATVTKKPDHRGEHENKPLKPLRREGRTDSGGPVVTTLVCFIYFAREAAGALATRLSLRPLFSEARTVLANLGRLAPRECGVVSEI